MLKVTRAGRFRKDVKTCQKRGYNMEEGRYYFSRGSRGIEEETQAAPAHGRICRALRVSHSAGLVIDLQTGGQGEEEKRRSQVLAVNM